MYILYFDAEEERIDNSLKKSVPFAITPTSILAI